jgi:hypothetical protein
MKATLALHADLTLVVEAFLPCRMTSGTLFSPPLLSLRTARHLLEYPQAGPSRIGCDGAHYCWQLLRRIPNRSLRLVMYIKHVSARLGRDILADAFVVYRRHGRRRSTQANKH